MATDDSPNKTKDIPIPTWTSLGVDAVSVTLHKVTDMGKVYYQAELNMFADDGESVTEDALCLLTEIIETDKQQAIVKARYAASLLFTGAMTDYVCVIDSDTGDIVEDIYLDDEEGSQTIEVKGKH